MKRCGQCGRANDDRVDECQMCGRPFASRQPANEASGGVAGAGHGVSPSRAPAADAPLRLAGVGRRGLALVIDTVALTVLLLASVMVASPGGRGSEPATWGVLVLMFAGPLLLGMLEGSSMQGTVGKRLLGMRVAGTDGQPIGIGRAVARNVAKYVLSGMLVVGYVFALVTARRQCLHDMVAGTLVVMRGDRR